MTRAWFLLAALVATPALAQQPNANAAPAQRPKTALQQAAEQQVEQAQRQREQAAQPAAPAPQRPAAPAARPANPRRRSALDSMPDTMRIDYKREVFNYQGGPRDPFQTLISSGAVRPTIDDLKLISVAYDARGGNSVAVVRELLAGGAHRMHRLRRGDQIGRLHVIQILPYQVVFQVEEFGFERQQTLTLQRPEVAR